MNDVEGRHLRGRAAALQPFSAGGYMRTFRMLFTVGAVLVVAFCAADFAWAQSRDPQLATLEGTVLATDGSIPLAGASASWTSGAPGSGASAVSGATDALGRFSFAIPMDRVGSLKLIHLTIDANGFQPTQRRVRVRAGRVTEVEVALAARPVSQIGSVTGMVTNARTGEGIEGAEIRILNAGGVLEAITDSSGTYAIPGVGFRPAAQIQMVTPSEADMDDEKPCLAPIMRTFAMDQPVVTQDFAGEPPMTRSPDCPTSTIVPPGGNRRVHPSAASPLATDASLQWSQADQLSILLDANDDAWNSGHINSIAKLDAGEGFLVGSDTGGVWAITSSQQAFSLSFNWDSINISSIAAGPGGNAHFYAGTYGSQGEHPANQAGVLWETDTSTITPLLNWSHVQPGPPCTSINKVLVIPEVNDVVLACDDSVWWSPIPPPPSVQGTYVWKAAILASGPPPPSNNFSGLAKGVTVPGTGLASIVAILHGGNSPQQLIYQGHWEGGELLLTPGSVGGSPAPFGRASIASCSANLNVQYAIAADANDNVLGGVWVSTDNGATWQPRPVPDAGNQGWYNQDVSVSPVECNTVALAFRNIGPYLSFDGAGSFTQITGGGPHQHSDLHALLFDPDDPNTVYVGSDGGLLAVHGINSTPTFQSNFNRDLLDLQAYHAVGSTRQKSLVAVSLQDNGTDDSLLWPVGTGSWEQQVDSDGSYSEFVTPVSLPQGQDILIRTENCCQGANWSSTLWNGTQFQGGQVIPVATPTNPRDPTGVPRGPVTRVRFPNFANSAGQRMYAAIGYGPTVFGLFANDDGGDLHWETVGLVGATEEVTSLSSFDGNTLFVGTAQTHIYRLNQPYQGPAKLLPINSPFNATGRVTSIAEFATTIAFATLDSGYVLGWQGKTWEELGGGTLPTDQPFNAVLLPDLADLIAMSPVSVYISHDVGTSWATANNGLPLIPQGQDLRYVIQPDNTQVIYLATYGHSVWRTVFRP